MAFDIGGLTQNWGGVLSKMLMWVMFGLIIIIIFIGLAAVIFFFLHKYKVYEFHLYGAGREGDYAVGMLKKNRIRWSKDKKSWRTLWPLFNKKMIEPFQPEHIYPGNTIFAIKTLDRYVPMRIDIAGDLMARFVSVPYHVRNWQSMEHKKNEIEFAKMGFWEQNKFFIMVIITIIICAIIAIATIWISFKFATGGVAATNGLTEAIKGFGSIK